MARSAPAPSTSVSLRPVWSQNLGTPPRGLTLAREKGWLLLWDDRNGVQLWNQAGRLQGQATLPGAVAAACAADDGSAFAAVGVQGEVWWLAPDLTVTWQMALRGTATTAALDPFGLYLAVADSLGRLNVLDRRGRRVFVSQLARPLQFVAFVPQQPFLVGCADYGLVICLDLKGEKVWQDGLVSNVGSLTVNGNGERIVLACYTEGLRCYSVTGRHPGRLPTTEGCRLAALSFDGQRILTADLSTRLQLLDEQGGLLATHTLDRPALALALGPLADYGLAAFPDGTLIGLEMR